MSANHQLRDANCIRVADAVIELVIHQCGGREPALVHRINEPRILAFVATYFDGRASLTFNLAKDGHQLFN